MSVTLAAEPLPRRLPLHHGPGGKTPPGSPRPAMPGFEIRIPVPCEPPLEGFPAAGPGRVELWQCGACGAMGMQDDCTGACADHAVELVRAADHDAAGARAVDMERWAAQLERVVEAVSRGPSSGGDWERCWRSWQRDARAALRARPRAGEAPAPAAEPVMAWWCATCGRVEAPQECLGVCTRRHEAWLPADAHVATVACAREADRRAERLSAVVELLAHVGPRPGGWEASVHAAQARARMCLAALDT